MGKGVDWNRVFFEEFVHLAMLNETEQKILRMRIDNVTVKEMADKLSMSESGVHWYISRIKSKYDAVQPFSEKLPIRRDSKEEEYMDTH